MERSAFTLYKNEPHVKQALARYADASLAELFEDSLRGNHDALRVLVIHCFPAIIAGFQDVLGAHPIADQVERSHEFFRKFLRLLKPTNPGTGILQDFHPSEYSGKGFTSMDAAFMAYLRETVKKMVADAHNAEDTGIQKLSPEEEARNRELNEEFLAFLRGHNAQYARVYTDMMAGKSIQEILESYAWKSVTSLVNKIAAMQDLYLDFLKDHHE